MQRAAGTTDGKQWGGGPGELHLWGYGLTTGSSLTRKTANSNEGIPYSIQMKALDGQGRNEPRRCPDRRRSKPKRSPKIANSNPGAKLKILDLSKDATDLGLGHASVRVS